MYVAFKELPSNARIWVYTAGRILTEQESQLISEKLVLFVQTWQSHQKDMKASFLIAENRFLVIAADESYNDISGCGIDKSFHVVQELENELGISLVDKLLVIFEREGKQLEVAFNKIKEAVSQGILDPETLFFNTLVANVAEFQSQFKVKSSEGWVRKYFSLYLN